MGNRSVDDKLKLPSWFSLDSYHAQRNFSAARQWLEQLAFRIDVRTYLDEFFQPIAQGRKYRGFSVPEASDTSLKWDQLHRLIALLLQNPLADVCTLKEAFAESGGDFPFSHLEQAGDWYRPAWRMSAKDFDSRKQLEKHEIPGNMREYIVVDTSVPFREAARAFREIYESSRKSVGRSKQINETVFARWCDDGVLPYIDLKIYESFEQLRSSNLFLAFTEEELAAAIYQKLPGKPERDPSSVSKITMPMADSLMNPESGLYKLLRIERTRQEHNSQRGNKEAF